MSSKYEIYLLLKHPSIIGNTAMSNLLNSATIVYLYASITDWQYLIIEIILQNFTTYHIISVTYQT